MFTAALLLASPWFPPAGVLGGALGAATLTVTLSTMLALPIWKAESGGFPLLDALDSFLIKDVALMGVSVAVLGEGLARSRVQ